MGIHRVKLADPSKFDIANPIKPKRFVITQEMVITLLVVVTIQFLVKIVLFDGLLFNPNLELDLVQHKIANVAAKITRVPDVDIRYKDIDTTNIASMMTQILKIFVVDPLIDKAEIIINRELDNLFRAIQPGKLSL